MAVAVVLVVVHAVGVCGACPGRPLCGLRPLGPGPGPGLGQRPQHLDAVVVRTGQQRQGQLRVGVRGRTVLELVSTLGPYIRSHTHTYIHTYSTYQRVRDHCRADPSQAAVPVPGN